MVAVLVLLVLLFGPALGYALIVGHRRQTSSMLAVESVVDDEVQGAGS
ncbi:MULTISPECIES: hypothetical protein [unclassified Nocardioides]